MRKRLLILLIGLLAALPLLGTFAADASAASSRVAVIKETNGSVKVKKSGGAKEFTAFAKMSLNEGDILAVEGGGSAVLQFSNGEAEDDRMTVAENTTLTFSKLKNANGTTTKVKMFSGSAWIDVKSIASADDEFTLETPTAIMGVRGTHLLVNVDPQSGATHLSVAAGVVNARTTDSANPDVRDVYPTQNALVADDRRGIPEITIAPVDLQRLLEMSGSSLVQAIVRAAGEISLENEEKIGQYELSDQPAGQERAARNIRNLVGAIVAQAIENRLVTPDRVQELLVEVRAQTGVSVDLTNNAIELTEEERLRQEEQREKARQAVERAKELKRQEEQNRLRDLTDRLNKERLAKEEEQRKKLEEMSKKALEEYEKRLTEQEKERFEKARAALEGRPSAPTGRGGEQPSQSGTSGSPTPTTSPDPNAANAMLGSLTLQIEQGEEWNDVPFGFQSGTKQYTVLVDGDNATMKLLAAPAAAGAAIVSVLVDDAPVSPSDGAYSFLYTGRNKVEVKIASPNGTVTETYTLRLQRPLTMEGISAWTSDPDAAWFKVAEDYFGGRAENSVNEIAFSFDFGAEVEYAEIFYKDQLFRSDENGRLAVSGLTAESYELFELRLYDSADYQIGDSKALWLMNGLSEPDFNSDEPFRLYADVASPYPIEYAEAEEDRYTAVSDHSRKGVLMKIPDRTESSLIVPIAVFDHQSNTYVETDNAGIMSVLKLPLQYGNNEFTVYATDRTGAFLHTYGLSIFRETAPYPLSDWSLDSGGTKQYWMEVKEAYGAMRYYADVPETEDTAVFRAVWSPSELHGYQLTDANGTTLAYSDDGSEGSLEQELPLQPGYNRFYLSLPEYGEVPYELVVVRGPEPELELGAVEFNQTISGEPVVLPLSRIDALHYAVHAVDGDHDDFTMRLLEHHSSDYVVYAPGYVLPDHTGTYHFSDVPGGRKTIAVYLSSLTYRKQAEISIDLYYNYDNANLRSFVLEEHDGSAWNLLPFDFDPATESYVVEMGEFIRQTKALASSFASGASVQASVDGGPFTPVNGTYYYLDASTLTTVLRMRVTALDGSTTRDYEVMLRRPHPDGISGWQSQSAAAAPVKWSLYGTSGISKMYETFVASNAIDMSFSFAADTAENGSVSLTRLTGTIEDKYHAMNGIPDGAPTTSDPAGRLVLGNLPAGVSYYKLQVFDASGIQVSGDHYLCITNTAP